MAINFYQDIDLNNNDLLNAASGGGGGGSGWDFSALPKNASLTSYWKFDEESGTREDIFGTTDLTDNGSVGFQTGIDGNEATFNGSSQYLSAAGFATPAGNFSISGWATFDTLASDQNIITKDNSTTNNRVFFLRYQNSTNRLQFRVSTNGTSATSSVLANTFGAPSTGTRYFIVATYESSTGTTSISINGGAFDTNVGTTGAAHSAAVTLAIGVRNPDSTPVGYLDGAVDEMAFYDTLLDSSDVTALYNSGAGLFPTFNSGGVMFFNGIPKQNSLLAYWTLDEVSSTREDLLATYPLTDNNTVAAQTGINGNEAVFVAANSEYLSNANFKISTGDFTISLWATLDSKPANFMHLFSRYGAAGHRSFSLFWDNSVDRFSSRVSNNGTTNTTVTATTFGAPVIGTRYHLVVTYRSSDGDFRIYVNGSLSDSTTAVTSGPYMFDTSTSLTVGAVDQAGATNFLDGKIDEIAVFDTIYSPEDVIILYNSGSGVFPS